MNGQYSETSPGEASGSKILSGESAVGFFLERVTAFTQAGAYEGVILFLVSLLAGRAALLQIANPFGLAFFAAAVYCLRRKALATGLGLLAGTWMVRPPSRLWEVGIYILFFTVGSALVLSPEQRERDTLRGGRDALRLGLLVLVSFVLAHVPLEYFWGTIPFTLTWYEIISSLLIALMTALASCIFGLAMPVILSPSESVAPQRGLCLSLLLAACVAGLHGLNLGPLKIKTVFAFFIVLVYAAWGGPASGTAVGTLMGLIASAGQNFDPAITGRFALAGLAAGAVANLGTFVSVIGYGITWLILSRFAPQTDPVTSSWHLILAGLLVMVPPWSLVKESLPRRKEVDLKGRLRTKERNAQMGDEMSGDAREATRRAGRQLRKFSQVFVQLAESFNQVGAGQINGEAVPRPNPSYLVERVADRVCRECARYEHCWEKNFYSTYQAIFESMVRMERSGNGSLSPELECRQRSELLKVVRSLYDLQKITQRWGQRIMESRELVSTQLRGVARVMGDLAERVADEPKGWDSSLNPKLGYKTGIATANKNGRRVSGDSHLIRELNGRQTMVLLSDGMGAGSRAALESRAAVTLLERLLDAGLEMELAVRSINAVLLLRSPEEIFTTLDLAIIDKIKSRVQFVKIGAVPSYIKRRDGVEIIASDTLPLGIVDSVDIERLSFRVKPGELLVMTSDGVLEVRREQETRHRWIVEYLRNSTEIEPQAMADGLVQASQQLAQGDVPDDITVLAVKFGAP